MIKTYSKAKNGDEAVSANFRVKEFACHDGSDIIYIDTALASLLQMIRDWAKGPVTINSGYRTPQYNLRVGGASESYHTKGQAADIRAAGKTPAQVAAYAEGIGAGGIGMYDGVAGQFVHVDTRPTRYRWINTTGANLTVSSHSGPAVKPACPYPTPVRALRQGSKGEDVKWIQWHLNQRGFVLSVDGVFGAKTAAAVTAFQKNAGLSADGIAGPATRGKLTPTV